MSSDIHNAAAVAVPIAGSEDRIVLAAATSRVAIPEAWLRANVSVTFDGADGYFAVTKDISLDLDETAVTTLTSSVPTAHAAAECSFAAQGVTRSLDLSKLPRLAGDETYYLAFKVASGYVRIERTSGPMKSA